MEMIITIVVFELADLGSVFIFSVLLSCLI